MTHYCWGTTGEGSNLHLAGVVRDGLTDKGALSAAMSNEDPALIRFDRHDPRTRTFEGITVNLHRQPEAPSSRRHRFPPSPARESIPRPPHPRPAVVGCGQRHGRRQAHGSLLGWSWSAMLQDRLGEQASICLSDVRRQHESPPSDIAVGRDPVR